MAKVKRLRKNINIVHERVSARIVPCGITHDIKMVTFTIVHELYYENEKIEKNSTHEVIVVSEVVWKEK